MGYLAPYAYRLFADVDGAHPWARVAKSSYKVLNWIFSTKELPLPPTQIFVDKESGELLLSRPDQPKEPVFSYDVFPIYWRVALDSRWWGEGEMGELRGQMLAFFTKEWRGKKMLLDIYEIKGQALSGLEGQPLYATVHALAEEEGDPLAAEIKSKKLVPLRTQALKGGGIPYYLHNWLWFDQAMELNVVLHFDEFLGFLRPFDYKSFAKNFPWVAFALVLLLYPLARRKPRARLAFLLLALGLCFRYIVWRFTDTLNFLEAMGPVISLALWLAEAYCFSTVLLLLLQVGCRLPKAHPEDSPAQPMNQADSPSVDIFIPIYSEPLVILEKTLWAALNIDYPNKKVYVCDDSHQDSVRELAEGLGAHYIRGPKKHAKAGNMNNALKLTSGELVVIFDTDHIPVRSFLNETVPHFANEKMGFVQTPHHFYNEDVFQKTFFVRERVPNEQDMFNHAIQNGRNSWGGAFFVGSGAVFRRKAVEEIGGFNTMSITEDIHTSQHLHARGWQSGFVDKDLAVGLTAENFASYLVQRRRWMLGCLQIFFKDNPLWHGGLSWRHRLGYFASLFYFFFPVVRLAFVLAPLAFLLFHWHPVFSDVSVLLAYLFPFMVSLPLLSSIILPSWPRLFWGSVYENAIAFPLARSLLDLFLPKNLGFKVTPKGITSSRASFDLQSAKLTLFMAGLTLFAILKGMWEFYFFQIEKDAYFFNLAWAIFNFFSLAMALAVAWERPQRRDEERLALKLPLRFVSGSFVYEGRMHDISLSGVGLRTEGRTAFPETGEIILPETSGLRLPVRLVYNESLSGTTYRVGLQFSALKKERLKALFLYLYTSPQHWQAAHAGRAHSNLSMLWQFVMGLARKIKFDILYFAGRRPLSRAEAADTKGDSRAQAL